MGTESILSRAASEQIGCQFVASLQSRVAYRFIVGLDLLFQWLK